MQPLQHLVDKICCVVSILHLELYARNFLVLLLASSYPVFKVIKIRYFVVLDTLGLLILCVSMYLQCFKISFISISNSIIIDFLHMMHEGMSLGVCYIHTSNREEWRGNASEAEILSELRSFGTETEPPQQSINSTTYLSGYTWSTCHLSAWSLNVLDRLCRNGSVFGLPLDSSDLRVRK